MDQPRESAKATGTGNAGPLALYPSIVLITSSYQSVGEDSNLRKSPLFLVD
jgi:hypothetical protein